VTNPMPTVTYQGETYKLRSRKIEIPDLGSMEVLAAKVWILQNTYPRGTNHRPPAPNLAGLGLQVR
jgi:hypothetical protein